MQTIYSIPAPRLLEMFGKSQKKSTVRYNPYEEQMHAEDDRWWRIFGLCLLTGAIVLFISFLFGRPVEHVAMAVLSHALFGAYFCLFASSTDIPRDFQPRSMYSKPYIRVWHGQGINLFARMLNRRNWPYVLRALRISLCVVLTGYPVVDFIAQTFAPLAWLSDTSYYLMSIFLCEAFCAYITAKTYE